MKERILGRIPARLRNRYGLAVGVLVLWITLFADYDLITMIKLRGELGKLHDQREHFAQEVEHTKEQLHQLNSDQDLLERFAREKYLMKRDNEDVFVLVPKKD